MHVNHILETCLYVDDLDVAEAFYRDVLGLVKFSRAENRHVFFRCGQGVFLLFNPAETVKPGDVPTHGAQGPGHVSFAMAKDKIDDWRDHLQQHKVEIEQEVTWPSGGYSLYFRDPAGNSVELATPITWSL